MNFDDIKLLTDDAFVNTFSRYNVAFKSGSGVTLTDTNGKQYKDFLAGIAVNALGYSHPDIVAVVKQQAEKFLHISNLFYCEEQAVLANLLTTMTGYKKTFLCNSGAEANEAAFKLARKYFHDRGEDKYEFITAQNSFHGRTYLAMTLTGQEKYSKDFAPLPEHIKYATFNDLADFESKITKNTAAIMLELVQGEGGVLPADKSFISGIVALCKQHNILLVIDEVQTGMGRCGELLCSELYGITPDIVTLSKALGGGLPLGAILVCDKLSEVFTPGSHGSTFGGNPLACATGTVLLDKLHSGLTTHVKAMSMYFFEQLSQLGTPRGHGLLIGLPLPSNIDGRTVVTKMLELGFIINCAGQNTLRFVPPLIIEKQDIDELVAALKTVLTSMS